ncbi:mpv17-like protein, partial [Eurytemora carolleeae]|uniref:mpv17-like protein n=1 Tax=Eurytemora carolleeae TaxID=1294199 RepID=UPI000C772D73
MAFRPFLAENWLVAAFLNIEFGWGVRKVLGRYPPLTNCLTYGTLFCTAELTQQIILKKYMPSQQGSETEEIDTDKLKRFAILGYTVIPNLMTVWYRWLDTRYTSTANKVIIKKVFLDQTCLTIPILVIFFTTMSYWEGKDDITAELREKFPVTFA